MENSNECMNKKVYITLLIVLIDDKMKFKVKLSPFERKR